MRLRSVFAAVVFASGILAQQPSGAPTRAAAEAASPKPAPVKGDTVVAVINGKNFTADQVRNMVEGTPPQARALFARDPKQFLKDHAYYLSLVDYAEKNGIDKMNPYVDMIAFYRLFVLSNAVLNERLRAIPVTPEEQKSLYEANKDRFREAQVRMIYIPFSGADGEPAAKEKAAGIAKRARAGEDFVKLAKEFSEDSASAGQDFKVRPDSKQPPEHMKKVVLQSTPGTVTEALRHENGYYVFRIESIAVLPYDQVQNDIYKEIQNTKFNEWQRDLRSQSSVQIQNEEFFHSAPPQ